MSKLYLVCSGEQGDEIFVLRQTFAVANGPHGICPQTLMDFGQIVGVGSHTMALFGKRLGQGRIQRLRVEILFQCPQGDACRARVRFTLPCRGPHWREARNGT